MNDGILHLLQFLELPENTGTTKFSDFADFIRFVEPDIEELVSAGLDEALQPLARYLEIQFQMKLPFRTFLRWKKFVRELSDDDRALLRILFAKWLVVRETPTIYPNDDVLSS